MITFLPLCKLLRPMSLTMDAIYLSFKGAYNIHNFNQAVKVVAKKGQSATLLKYQFIHSNKSIQTVTFLFPFFPFLQTPHYNICNIVYFLKLVIRYLVVRTTKNHLSILNSVK